MFITMLHVSEFCENDVHQCQNCQTLAPAEKIIKYLQHMQHFPTNEQPNASTSKCKEIIWVH